jgi:hypothetical protein
MAWGEVQVQWGMGQLDGVHGRRLQCWPIPTLARRWWAALGFEFVLA